MHAKDSTLFHNTAPFFRSCRFCLAVIGFLGMIIIYASRIDLSVGIVCMVNHTGVRQSFNEQSDNDTRDVSRCGKASDAKEILRKDGEFVWSKETQGLVLGSFFYGYLGTQILGGLAAQWLGAKRILGVSVFLSGVLTLLTPVFSRISASLLVAVRVVLGFSQGVVFPAFHTMWSHWAPPYERSKLTSLTYAGAQIGNVITLPLAGILCDYGFAGGWPSIFYLIGIVAILWCFAWAVLASDSAATHPRISERERRYIVDSLSSEIDSKKGKEKLHVPWKQVLTSKAVWAILIAHFAADWGTYIMLTCLPSFMSEVLEFEITTLGFLASLPYILYFICINAAGFLADFIRKRQLLNTLNTRRLMNTIALVTQGVFLIATGYCTCGQELLAVALLTIGTGLSGFQYSGFIVNYMDIAPAYAGTILGIGNTISCISGFLGPATMGWLTDRRLVGDDVQKGWQYLFWLSGIILFIGALVFYIFAAGDVLPWARVRADDETVKVHDDERYTELKETVSFPKFRTGVDEPLIDAAASGNGIAA